MNVVLCDVPKDRFARNTHFRLNLDLAIVGGATGVVNMAEGRWVCTRRSVVRKVSLGRFLDT